MIIKTDTSTNYLFTNNKTSLIPTLFLHGFSGTSNSWKEVISMLDSYCIAPDIVGHGKSSFNNIDGDYNIDDYCDDLLEILDILKVDKLNVCGYSMGGRLAIAFAAKNPNKIETLFLESTSLGIKDKKARKERYKKDLKLSETIENDLSKFVKKWENNPLFLKQKERNQEAFLNQRKNRLSHTPIQLTKALKVFSQGNIKSYEKEFLTFKFPIMIINGKEDTKYLEIGKDMKAISQISVQYSVANSGHNTHLEQPNKFVDYLTSISDPSDICKHCDDVIAYCKCYENVIADTKGN